MQYPCACMSCHSLVRLFDANCWPTICGGKKVKQHSIFKLTQQHTNNWEVDILFLQWIVSPMLMSHHLGMDEFTIFIMMTNNRMSLLKKFPRNVHVYTLSQCWLPFWMAMGHMCNVNMWITFCKWLCFMGSWKSPFITVRGIGVKFSVCYYILKPLNFNDNTSQLHLHQINCDFLIHKTCCTWLDYEKNLDFGYDLKIFLNCVLFQSF
jgi:hypothetical protein